MMNIAHTPNLIVEQVQDWFLAQKEQEYSYVATTTLPEHDPSKLFDVYWSGTDYYGVAYSEEYGEVTSQRLEDFEELLFTVVEDDGGYWRYSESVSDYREFLNGNIIQGGRSFTYANGTVRFLFAASGELEEAEETFYFSGM
jgi:hypothetical protein